jgi:hypothetical protein
MLLTNVLLIILSVGLIVLAIVTTLFALLAGREGPPILRGVKRWIESRLH